MLSSFFEWKKTRWEPLQIVVKHLGFLFKRWFAGEELDPKYIESIGPGFRVL